MYIITKPIIIQAFIADTDTTYYMFRVLPAQKTFILLNMLLVHILQTKYLQMEFE